MSNLSHFSAFASCLVYFDSNATVCNPRASDNGEAFRATYALLLVIGMVNNIMSVLVFTQPHYSKRLVSRLLKYYYQCTVVVLFFLCLTFILTYVVMAETNGEDSISTVTLVVQLIFRTTFKISYGILAYLAVVRYMNYTCPMFIAYSKHAKTLTWLVLEIVTAVSIGIHLKSFFTKRITEPVDLITDSVFYLTSIFIMFVFNVLWIYVQATDTLSLSTYPNRKKSLMVSESKRTVNYALIATILCVVPTIPRCVAVLINPPYGWVLSCSSCKEMLQFTDILLVLQASGIFFDNLVYVALSRKYRHDLLWALKRISACKGYRTQRLQRLSI